MPQPKSRLSPDEITRIRERLRLSKRQASKIFGGGRDAFARYEAGAVQPGVALCHLLRLLDADTRRFEELLETSSGLRAHPQSAGETDA
jgi:HTH-type transcriptional regulator/antitoxin MqsA